MPSAPLDHRNRPFDLSLEQYAALVREAAFARARATGVGYEARLEPEPERAKLTVSDGERTRVVVTLVERNGRARVVEARALWRVRAVYPLLWVVPTLLLAPFADVWGALIWTQFWMCALCLLFSRAITYPSERRLEPLLRLLGDVQGEAIVSDSRAPAPVLLASKPLGRVDAALRIAEPTSIEKHKDGELGKIVGRIRHGERVVRAPVSGRPCAYWELRVSESETPIGTLRQREPFIVEDHSGQLHITPAEAQISAQTDYVHECSWAELPKPLHELVTRLYDSSELRARTRRPFAYALRIEEGVIEEGEEIAVMGQSILQHDPARNVELGGYRAHAKGRRCLVHSARAPLLVSDSPALHDRVRL